MSGLPVWLDSDLYPALEGNEKVGVYPVSSMPALPLPGVLRLAFKAVWQSISLFRVMAYRTPPAKWIILQVGTSTSRSTSHFLDAVKPSLGVFHYPAHADMTLEPAIYPNPPHRVRCGVAPG